MTNDELIANEKAKIAEEKTIKLKTVIQDTISTISGWKFVSPSSKQIEDMISTLRSSIVTENNYTTIFGPYVSLGNELKKGYKVTKLLNGNALSSEKFDDRETALAVKEEWEAQNK